MDIVFLVYGLAFLALGLVLVIWPKQDSRLELSSLIHWLAAFAFAHGALEWMDLWRVVRGDNPGLAVARPFTLLASYVLLFEFGRRLLLASLLEGDRFRRPVLSGYLHVGLLAGVAAGALAGEEMLRGLTIWSRYLYGFPAALLAGVGFWLYCRDRVCPTLDAGEIRPVLAASRIAGIAFVAYAVFGGLVVPRADWAPAAWLNQEGFQAASGIPVQLFRAACALAVAVSVAYILRIFQLERGKRLRAALDQAQAALDRADHLGRRNRLLLESVAEGIFGIDRQGNATFINPAALAMLGYRAEELIGQPMHALTHHSHADGARFPVETCPSHLAMQDGQTRHVENDHFWRRDGSHFPVEYHTARISEAGQTIGAVVVFQDITQRLRVEADLAGHRLHLEDLVARRTEELREQEERGRLILEASGNGLYGMDVDGRVIFVNPAGGQMLGYAPEALIGKPVHATLHHRHADGSPFPAADCPMLAAIRHGEPVRNEDDLF